MSDQYFRKPLPLLMSTSDGLKLNEETANILAKITQPVVVVAIAGKYRTGKSYILNLLSDLPRESGFELGDTVESFTKGIWVYALPHPKRKNTTLVLLDTEGLGDVNKGDLHYDTTLLVLTILLSSTFILNVTGRLDDEIITQLGFVSMLTKSMKTKANDVETGKDFGLFFPRLVVLVRDFCLQLIIDGKEVTADDYFNEYCLKIKDKSENNFEKYNEPRKLIRKYFPKRNCVTLPLPVFDGKSLRELEKVPDDKLNPEFLKESKDFIAKMLTVSEPKTLTAKSRVNGTILVTMLRNYLEQVKNGAVPCVETTLQSTARIENEKLLRELLAVYSEKMSKVLNLPSSLVVITEMHQMICQQLMDEFKQRIIFDDEKNELEKKYTKEVNDVFNEIIKENEEASKRECENRLKSLCVTLDSKLNDKVYYKPGGYSQYSKDLHDVIEYYNKVEEKGVKHEEVLCNFVAERFREGNQISALDEQMSDSERKAEEARREKEHAEQFAKMQQEHFEQMQKQQEEMKRTYEETQKQLKRELDERNKKHDELLIVLAETKARKKKEHAEQIAKMQQLHSEQMQKQQEEMKRTYEETQKQLKREVDERREKELAEKIAKMQQEHDEQTKKQQEEMKRTYEKQLQREMDERREKEHAEKIAKMQQEHDEQMKKQQEEMKRTDEESRKLRREIDEKNEKERQREQDEKKKNESKFPCCIS